MAKTNLSLSDFFQYADVHTESYTYQGRTYERSYAIFESADDKQSFITPLNATLSRMLKLCGWIKAPQFSVKLNRGKSKTTGRDYHIQNVELVAWQPVSAEERAELEKLNVANAIAQAKSNNPTTTPSNADDGGVKIGD